MWEIIIPGLVGIAIMALLFILRRRLKLDDVLFNAIIGLLTTFVGAYIAFGLTNYQSDKDKKATAKVDLKMSMNDLGDAINNYRLAIAQNKNPSDTSWFKIFKENPPELLYFNSLFTYESIRTVLSPATVAEVSRLERNIPALVKYINESNSNAVRYTYFHMLLMFLEYSFIQLQTELSRQNGDISPKDLVDSTKLLDLQIGVYFKGDTALQLGALIPDTTGL
jgi:hypothetical protein